jgi:hypothetical protein
MKPNQIIQLTNDELIAKIKSEPLYNPRTLLLFIGDFQRRNIIIDNDVKLKIIDFKNKYNIIDLNTSINSVARSYGYATYLELYNHIIPSVAAKDQVKEASPNTNQVDDYLEKFEKSAKLDSQIRVKKTQMMVEAICPNCGNRKSFEDSYVGRIFKCPICSNPVTIQNLGSQLNTEPAAKTNSFADEISRAEAEKKKQDEETRKKVAIEANEKNIKNYLYYGIAALLCGIAWILSKEYLGLGVVSVGVGLWLLVKRNKMKNGEA